MKSFITSGPGNKNTYENLCKKKYLLTCAPSEDPDQSAHPCSLIRVFSAWKNSHIWEQDMRSNVRLEVCPKDTDAPAWKTWTQIANAVCWRRQTDRGNTIYPCHNSSSGGGIKMHFRTCAPSEDFNQPAPGHIALDKHSVHLTNTDIFLISPWKSMLFYLLEMPQHMLSWRKYYVDTRTKNKKNTSVFYLMCTKPLFREW